MLKLAEIRSIAQDSEGSQTIFDSLAERKRTRKITDLRQLQYKLLDEGAKLTKEDVMRTFQALEDAGVGSIIIGRKGKPTRFKWNYSIKRVAKAGVNRLIKKKAKVNPEPSKTVPSSRRMTTSEFAEKVKGLVPIKIFNDSIQAVISTTVKIRANFTSKIELPLDLKKEDIDELSKKLYSLVQIEPEKKESGLKTENISKNDNDLLISQMEKEVKAS